MVTWGRCAWCKERDAEAGAVLCAFCEETRREAEKRRLEEVHRRYDRQELAMYGTLALAALLLVAVVVRGVLVR